MYMCVYVCIYIYICNYAHTHSHLLLNIILTTDLVDDVYYDVYWLNLLQLITGPIILKSAIAASTSFCFLALWAAGGLSVADKQW